MSAGPRRAAPPHPQPRPRPGTHDGVVRAEHRGPAVRRDHQTHLQELAGLGRQPPLEPEQREHAADAHVLPEHLRDGDPGVEQLLAELAGFLMSPRSLAQL